MGRWSALALTGLAAAGLALLVRRCSGRFALAVRVGLAGLLLAGVGAYLGSEALAGRLSVWDFVPLHLCDFAIFVAAFALLTLRPLAVEIVWFWALSGTTLAIVTPDVAGSFPDWRWLAYFGLHGSVVVSAIVLVAGLGVLPRPGAPWRVFGWTVLYAAVVGVVDWTTGANFLYLRQKPVRPTLLDAFGPWPVYIVVAAGVALGLFWLLHLPFRRRRETSP